MLVEFVSSETGEVLMFGETAAQLLDILGKDKTRRGSFLQPEMLPAAERLRAAVQENEAALAPQDDEEEEKAVKDRPIVLRQRAWPLIDMLERTARSGPEANIVWEASADFG